MFNAHASTLNFLQINEIGERKHGGISTGIYNVSMQQLLQCKSKNDHKQVYTHQLYSHLEHFSVCLLVMS